MKKIIISIFIIMLLSGATVSVMKWLKLGPFAEPTEMMEKTAPVKKIVQSTFLDMEPLVIPLYNGNKAIATVQIQVKLEVLGKENSIKVQRIMTRIKDKFLSDLYAFLPRLIKQEERIKVSILKERLKIMAGIVAGPDLINDVLVQSVQEIPK